MNQESDKNNFKIPHQLEGIGFRFVKLRPKTKMPFEPEWQRNPYDFDEIAEWVKQGNNYGIAGGHGGLIIIDQDRVELREAVEKKLPQTFTVKSREDRRHSYYLCPEITEKIVLRTGPRKEDHYGEIISFGSQVVGPGSIHPETNMPYEVVNDVALSTVSREGVFSALADYLPANVFGKQSKDYEIEGNVSLNVIEVLEKFGVSVNQTGRQLQVSHPVHGSENGGNFVANSEKNVWHCFRCQSGGGAMSLIAVLEGIIDCNQAVPGGLRGEDFKKTMDIAREKYGLVINTEGQNLQSRLRGYEVDRSRFNIIRIKKDSFEYGISGIERTREGVKAAVTLTRNGQRLNKNRFCLSSAQARKIFANDCTKNHKNEDNEKIRTQLMDIEEILATTSATHAEGEHGNDGPELTAEETREAEEVLKSPTLLYDIKKLFPRLLIAGEEKNCLLIYLSGTSRILDSPVSLTGKGESSVGKSYTVGRTLILFPKSCYEDISDATKMSFYHAKKDMFKHKIIVLFEKPGTEQTDYSIRTMQSEKKLKLQITIKNPETGEYGTEIKEVEGPVAFITTTTSPNIHPENETRCFSFYGDNSEDQTLSTFEMTDAKYRGIQEISKEELAKFVNIQKIIKPYPVLIPYVVEIRKKFPLKVIRVRRDYGRLLALIEVITVLHQFQRQKKEKGGKEYLVSTLADYYIAKVIAEDILRQTIFELPPKSKQLVRVADELLTEKKNQGKDPTFTIRELSRKSGDDYDTAQKWFSPAFEHGYFEIQEEHRGSKAAKYSQSKHSEEDTAIIPGIEELANLYPEIANQIYDPLDGKTIQLKQ